MELFFHGITWKKLYFSFFFFFLNRSHQTWERWEHRKFTVICDFFFFQSWEHKSVPLLTDFHGRAVAVLHKRALKLDGYLRYIRYFHNSARIRELDGYIRYIRYFHNSPKLLNRRFHGKLYRKTGIVSSLRSLIYGKRNWKLPNLTSPSNHTQKNRLENSLTRAFEVGSRQNHEK